MTHFATRICSGFLCGILFAAGAAQAQRIPPGEILFPKSTQGFIAITSVDSLIEHFDNTQLGKLAADPVMKPFTEDVKRQFENRWSNVHERLGVTLDDLRDVPGGEVCIGLIDATTDPKNIESAIALTVDITGRHDQAKAMLEKVNKNLSAKGAKQTEIKNPYFPQPIIQFLLPENEEEREAVGSTFGVKPNAASAKLAASEAEAPQPRYAFYFTSGNFLCATDHLNVMSGILARFAGKGAAGGALADVQGYRMISQRCAADAVDVVPQLRWFIHPIGYAAAARAATPAENRRKGKTFLEILRNQGFDAIQGVGGYASFSDENFDLVHRTAVYAPEPYVKSMKMMKFINGADYTPQVWVPRDVATYSTVYFDILNAFDNFGPLFNELYGGGDENQWEDTLNDLKTDEHSARIDIREELIAYLGQRVTLVTDYQMPITTSSERILIAIEVKDEEAIAKGIAKWMKCDPNAKMHEIDGRVIWEIVDEEASNVAPPKVDFGDEPSLNAPPKKPVREEKIFPHLTVTVAHKQLFIASHKDFMLKILEPKQERQLLRNDADYQLVSTTIKNMLPNEKCAGVFSRTDEEYHPTYELIRQNKMPESESMLGRLLNQLFGEGKKGQPRHQKIDGSQLPEYDAVRRYLGPAGLQATAEKDGWFIKGFTISKELPTPELKEELKSEPKDEEQATPKEEATPKEQSNKESAEDADKE